MWNAEIPLTKALPPDEVVWHRVRYRFQYAGAQDAAAQGTESISEILRTPVVHVLGQQSYLAGGAAAVRLIVTDSKNDAIPGDSTARIELVDGARPRLLFAGRLNRRGTAEAQFRFPAGLAGRYSLRYVVETPIGSTEIAQPVKLEAEAQILLTTEKPVYQPGQTIHVRALALDRANHAATAARKITLEAEDSRGNKVFKKVTQTSAYGVASADFGLADEVNLGTYHLRALLDGGDEGGSKAEIAVNVERYVLPKFKVAVEFTGKQKHGYRPGDRVTGTVRANYFFGKAVDGGEVEVKASAMDVGVVNAGSAQGKTDADGVYHFDFKLPDYFAGLPLQQGLARVLVEASVKDSAGHAETRGEGVTVSQSPLILTAIPEGGTMVPGLENQVFVLASYADGAPAVATLKVRAAGNAEQTVTTDAGGVAVVKIHAGANQALEVEASDAEGNRVKSTVPLEMRAGGEQILLRTERAVYRAGERIALKVFSTKSRGTAYVDVVKNGQTVLTRDLDLVNGVAELSLAATPGPGGDGGFQRLSVRPRCRPGGRSPAGVRAARRRIEDRGGERCSPIPPRPGCARAFPRDQFTRRRSAGGAGTCRSWTRRCSRSPKSGPGSPRCFLPGAGGVEAALRDSFGIHARRGGAHARGDRQGRAARPRGAGAVCGHRGGPAQSLRDGNRTRRAGGQAGRVPEPVPGRIRHAAGAVRGQGDAHPARQSPGRRPGQTGGTGRHARCMGHALSRVPAGGYYFVNSAGADRQFGTGDDLGAYLQVRTSRVAGPPLSQRNSAGNRRGARSRSLQRARGVVGRGEVFQRCGGGGREGHATRRRSGAVRTAAPNSSGQICWPDFRRANTTVEVRRRDSTWCRKNSRCGRAIAPCCPPKCGLRRRSKWRPSMWSRASGAEAAAGCEWPWAASPEACRAA